MPRLRLIALAAAACLAAPVTPASASSLVFTGIRPGTLLLTENYAFACTANFVFQTTGNAFDKTQQLYLGTAGHCGSVGDHMSAIFVPPGRPRTTLEIGTVVFSVDDGLNDDFALIQLDPALNDWVSPSMAWWGGPTGIYPGSGGDVATWTGNGGYAGGTVPRVGKIQSHNSLAIWIITVGAEGDSGSAVNSIGGLAVGALAKLDGSVGTNAYGPSIERMVTLAGHPLATCASAKPWPLPGCPPV